jgi:hypothetical protein
MPNNRDAILLETVKTHRTRLMAAFLFGELPERRVAGDNLKRLLGSVVLAAVLCAGCVGFSFIASVLAGQAQAKQAQSADGPATQPPYASDGFDRSVDRGWGPADLGGDWAPIGDPGALAVSRGAGTIDLVAGERGAYLPAQQRDNTDLTVMFARPAGGAEVGVLGRRVGPDQDYRADVRTDAAGTVTVVLTKKESGKAREVMSQTIKLLGTPQPGEPISVRLQVRGESSTTIRAKVWWVTAAEPQTWTVSATDSSTGLQRPGTVGIVAAGPAGTTLSVLDLVARPTNN